LKFGQLTLGKIIKIVATRCQILRLKCTKFNFGCSSASGPAGGAYSAVPDPLAALRDLLLREGEGTRPHHFTPTINHISGYAPVYEEFCEESELHVLASSVIDLSITLIDYISL